MQFKKIVLHTLLMVICLVKIPQAFANPDDSSDTVITPATTTVHISGQSQDMIGNMLIQSISLMGIPYKWGGNTPQTGMDCSGFIRYVFQKSLGINLPRTAAGMAKVGKKISLNDLEPGDLIFFNTERGANTHVGMYIGNNKFIQSPKSGESIKVTNFDSYWRRRFNGAKRIVQEYDDDNGSTALEDYQDITDEALPVRAGISRHRHKRGSYYRRHKQSVKSHGKPTTKKAKRVVIAHSKTKSNKKIKKNKKH